MSRRGRRQARRHWADQRERLVDDWLRWREETDTRAGERLRRELQALAHRPGWRLAPSEEG